MLVNTQSRTLAKLLHQVFRRLTDQFQLLKYQIILINKVFKVFLKSKC